jgi:hypothetical protein
LIADELRLLSEFSDRDPTKIKVNNDGSVNFTGSDGRIIGRALPVRRNAMRAANFLMRSVVATAAGIVSLIGAYGASAAPVPGSTALLKTAAPAETTTVGYLYRDGDGAWISGRLAVGFVGATAVSPFYDASYYPAYVYAAPPVYYAPLPYEGPAVVYGRPLLAADPYYPALYPYVRGPRYFGYWRR